MGFQAGVTVPLSTKKMSSGLIMIRYVGASNVLLNDAVYKMPLCFQR